MRKDDNENDEIREMLKKKGYRVILRYATHLAGNKPGIINEPGLLSSVSHELFHNSSKGTEIVQSAIKDFKKVGIFYLSGDSLLISEKAFRYVSRK